MISTSIIKKLNSNPIKKRITELFQKEGKSYSRVFDEISIKFLMNNYL